MNTPNKGGQRLVVASAVAALFAGPAAQALAADIKVEVTGSNIKRIEGEGALPVQVIGREEIARSGAQNAMEIMNLVSANNSLGNVSLGNVIGSTTFSNQTASLRGLGGQATLVLVNGKRVGTFGGAINAAEGVNLASIPFSAIERVEVLKDGASAVYGSDAIAGVINFIMRQDFTGVEATAWAGTPTRKGGGDEYNFRATAGYGDLSKDKFNVFLTGSYNNQKNLLQSDRNFSAHSYNTATGLDTSSGNTFPGYVSTGGIGSFVQFPDCPNPNFNSGTRCRFDPSQYQMVEQIPDTKQTNFYGSGRYQINNDWQAYLLATYSKQETNYIIQPVPLSDQFSTPPNNPIFAQYPLNTILLPPTSPFYPHAQAAAHGVDGQPLNVRYRAVENGNRDTTDTNEQWNIVAGAKGSAWSWDWDGSFNYGQNTTRQVLNGGFPLLTRILPLLNSGVVNLFGPNTPAVTQQILATNYNGPTFNGKLTGYGIDLNGSRDVYPLPAGPLALALGLQAGKETLSQNPAGILATGDISGYGGNLAPFEHSRTVWAVFGELNIPIVKSLEGNLAVRYDHYSDFGSTTNPKVSLRWQPVQSLLLRGSWGTGFLAPTLYELWNGTTQGVTSPGLSDPLRCPTTGDSNDCDTQFTTSNGGSPDLKPTKSNQTTVGGVWEPLNGLSLGVDWFYLILKDQLVTGVPQSTILGDLNQYGHLVTRGPVQPAFPNLPGPITSIYQHWVNLGQTKIQGIDVDARFKAPVTSFGQFSGSLSGTYYIQYLVQQGDGSFAGFVSNAFQAPATGITPRWKSYVALNWNYGDWAATLGNSYQSSYVDVLTDPNDNLRRVGSLSLWDLQANYTGFRNFKLTLGAKNLFDTNPPLTNQNNTFQVGFDPSYYDPRARFLYGSVTYTFK
jgi:iron complex outermembrane receptor protein